MADTLALEASAESVQVQLLSPAPHSDEDMASKPSPKRQERVRFPPSLPTPP